MFSSKEFLEEALSSKCDLSEVLFLLTFKIYNSFKIPVAQIGTLCDLTFSSGI